MLSQSQSSVVAAGAAAAAALILTIELLPADQAIGLLHSCQCSKNSQMGVSIGKS